MNKRYPRTPVKISVQPAEVGTADIPSLVAHCGLHLPLGHAPVDQQPRPLRIERHLPVSLKVHEAVTRECAKKLA